MSLFIDIVAIAVVVLAARRGWRIGASTVAAKLVGLVIGLVVGLVVADELVSARVSPVAHLLLGLLLVLGFVILGGRLGSMLAAGLVRRVGGPVRTLDRVAGVALRGGLAAGVVSIVLALVASVASLTWASAARGSAVAAASAPAGTALRDVGSRALQVAPDDIAALVPSVAARPPDAGAAARVAEGLGGSVVEVFSRGCAAGVQGTGFAVGNGNLVVTNAHVVRGATEVQVRQPDGHSAAATVVAFASGPDLALLAVSDLDAAPLIIAGSDVANGSPAVVVGYPGGTRTTTPAAVLERLPVPDPDWADHVALHVAYLIDAPVRHGNSGSPLLDMHGRVVGVVNALSRTDSDGGYAIADSELRRVLAQSTGSSSPVPTGTCATAKGTS